MGKPITIDTLTRLRQAEALVAQLTDENARLRANLEYVAMMTDVEIDDDDSESESQVIEEDE